jgi:hypothetical protein
VKTTRYLQLSTALPIVVPIAVFAAAALLEGLGGAPEWLMGAALFLLFSLILGGVPYAVVAAVMLWLTRRKGERFFVRFAWVAPAVYAAVMFLVFFAISFADASGHDPVSCAKVGLIYAGFALAFGYAYVLLVELLLVGLRYLGVVERPSAL